MSEAGESLGGRLKAEREKKGFSAQKAADQLHLDAWVIEALESGDYARIGPSVYGKGHLKRYAGLLGLPADEIIGAYENRPAAPALRTLAVETPDRAPPWATVAGVAVISVLAAAAAVLWWRPWQSRPAAAIARTASSAASTAQGTGATTAAGGERGRADDGSVHGVPGTGVQPNAGSSAGAAADGRPAERVAGSASLAAVDSAPAGGTEPVPGAGHARLRLSFSADSWVDVHDASGHRLFAGRGHANSVKTIAGAAPMKVYLGFASGVQLEVNNHVVAIGPQFVAGDVAHFEAGADGVLRRDVHASAAGDPHPRG
jgi:cytoskeleton protein RodZ